MQHELNRASIPHPVDDCLWGHCYLSFELQVTVLEFQSQGALADLGGMPGAGPPTVPNSFVFTIFTRKVPMSEVHAPRPN